MTAAKTVHSSATYTCSNYFGHVEALLLPRWAL